ncbi:MAG: lamin tail domain-containing protein [Solirubrobacterales bacterium]
MAAVFAAVACLGVALLALGAQPAAAVSTTLVINEVDYDQPSSDTAEFLEIKNVSASTINLDPYSVEFINGASGGAANYRSLDLPNFNLAVGDYYVICGDATKVTNCDLDTTPNTDLIQNGAPDALAIKTGSTLVDIVSYEGNTAGGYVEGSGVGLIDDASSAIEGISRCADGNDTDNNAGDFTVETITPGAGNDCGTVTPPAPTEKISAIQGAVHTSPFAGQSVTTNGIVTAVAGNGYYIQEPDATIDANPATSEGIFVFTSSAPAVAVGDSVSVQGSVSEYRAGGSGGLGNLTVTELTGPVTTVVSSGNPLPTTTTIGSAGRVAPTTVIDDDATGSVETSGSFDHASDGIDFYESLEGMHLTINNAVATGPTNNFGEISVLPDSGAGAGLRTLRGGIIVRPTDFNPERVILDDVITATPQVNVGDGFAGPVAGVLDYSFGNFKLQVTGAVARVDNGLTPEVTSAVNPGEISTAGYNVENLDANDPDTKFERLAEQIVVNLRSPDILALDEVQDNNGATNDGTVAADQTLAKLIDAIADAGGPTYSWRSIDPVNGQDGGEPGGNIRVAFLYRSDRGVSFVDRPGGTSTSATTVVAQRNVASLSASPGRIDPTNSAFSSSRKPLVGEFSVRGERQPIFVIANHWNSKGGDNPLFGRFQPPVLSSEVQRVQQAQIVHDFVESIVDVNPAASVLVIGDLNDFGFSQPLTTLKGAGLLADLADALPESERYSYVFDGNSQQLDHALASSSLASRAELDLVHVNAEFADQASDHDPTRAKFCHDTTPPRLRIELSKRFRTSSNGEYIQFRTAVGAADLLDPAPQVEFVGISRVGGGVPDDEIEALGPNFFRAPAQDPPGAEAREYAITYRATDSCGNVSTASIIVKVPLLNEPPHAW